MARAARPQLAKLSRPRISRALARPRLFAALDRALEARGVWIAGRPGGGKTTLVSTYLDARKHSAQWYQVDAQDADVANVFHYLATVVPRSAASARKTLPVFTPDAHRDLHAFARRFFRSFFAFAGSPLTLVFDNAHEAASKDLHCLLAVALGEAPLGSSLIVVSRDEVPAELVGALASRALSTLDPGSLNLTEDEAVALAAALGDHDGDAVRALQRRVDGWPAGIVLLTNAQRGMADAAHRDHGIEHVFDYFAAEVFSSLDPTTQRVLLTTAMLPDSSANTAAAISAIDDAATAIEHCYRRHLFVERRDVVTDSGDVERRYQYHPLFAAFLRARGEQTFAADALSELRRNVIALMARSERADATIAASLGAQELTTARALLVREAQRFLREGRHQQLMTWITAADADRQEPWLSYWAGLAQTHFDQQPARAMLRHAFEGFVASGDTRGQLLAAAAMLEAIQSNWSTFEGLEQWLAAAERVYRAGAEAPDAATELRVLTGVISGVLLLRPSDPQLLADAERLFTLLEYEGDANDRMAAALCLMPVAQAFNRAEWLPRIGGVAGELLKDVHLTPRKRAEYWLMVELSGDPANNRLGMFTSGRRMAREIATENGLGDLLCRVAMLEAEELYDRDPAAAEPLMHEAERWLDPARLATVQEYHVKRAQLAAILHRDGDAALRHSELAIAAARRAHAPRSLMVFAAQMLPVALLLRGEFEAAIDAAEASAKDTFPQHAAATLLQADLIRAWQAIVEHASDRDAILLRAMRKARQMNRLIFMRALPRETAILCQAALEAKIEVDFVTRVIRHRRLLPPSRMTEAWPWPVRIRVFGTLGIERDGVPVAFSGKSQKRPLELIKALIAAGDGPASAADLAAALWPDAEGDSAATSLRVNLHRARKLLGYDEALVFEDGKLAFNRNMVWSDRWAFDACVVDIASDDATDAPGPPTDASSRLLSLYRGPLLRDDGDAPWLVADRARCRDALLRAIARVGQACEMRLQWSDAIALYERGIEAEPLAEDLYRALMRCHAAVGQVPEALRAYRRCREILSILLGVKPSAATETLLREIHG